VASIIDVARLAKVSPATVSRVLNGTAGVSAERAERVRAAVEKLQYQPFSPARALRKQLTDVWAVIVADVENPFFTSVVRGIEDGAQEFGRRVLLCNSDEDLAKEAGYIDVAVAERVGGVVISVASTKQSDLTPFLSQGIPVVAIDRRPIGTKVDSVLVDNRLASKQATEHLIEGGGELVACITGPKRISTANERLRGYRDGLEKAGRAYDESLVLREDFRQAGGHEAVQQLFAGKKHPDALFVANNLMTLGALAAIREAGLRVPEDVSVVGFDGIDAAGLARIGLTTVAQPREQLAAAGIRLLLERIEAGPEAPPRTVLLEPKLVVRSSTRREP